MITNTVLNILYESLMKVRQDTHIKMDRIEDLTKQILELEVLVSESLEVENDLMKLISKYGGSLDAAGIAFFITEPDGSKKEVTEMFLKVSQKINLAIEIKDKFGNAAQIDGMPQWALTDEALGALAVAEDGKSAEFIPAGPVGALKVQVKCDADLGEGVKEILGELDIELVAGEAVAVELKAGEPVEV